MSTDKFFAHSHPDQPTPGDKWQPLADHLREVARLARRFAEEARPLRTGDDEEARKENDEIRSFHEAAYWAGLLHDLGKYREEFQQLIRGLRNKGEQTRHKQAGAAAALDRHRRSDVAFAIAGHHAGLPDAVDLKELIARPGGRDLVDVVWQIAREDCPEMDGTCASWQAGSDRLRFDLLVRLLFSCLVDADWQDTSAHVRRSKGLPSEPDSPELNAAELLPKVLRYVELRAQSCRDQHIRTIRKEILDSALQAAKLPPGLFAMAVPTGGGKTLSALAFALRHAQLHGLRRIIYVAPYLSIIEQNAREIRRALGDEGDTGLVFEHHSLAEPTGDSEDDDSEAGEATRRAENWDSPVIVTTSVQFYESLFSNGPGQCRKLHNVARSVVILDECQTLPPGLVAPTCSILRQLAEIAGCSIVLCTATQPAWSRRDDFTQGLINVHSIVPATLNLFERLRRVKVHWPERETAPLEWSEIARKMLGEQASLCVVNKKRSARDLFRLLQQEDAEGCFHLSTAMCPAHRLEVLDEVRRRLTEGLPCRLVSTQVVEAGVDVDFPLVMREMAPLEAIVQAAGRCNREGLLNASNGTPGGRVIVFRAREGGPPRDPWYEAGIAKVEQNFLADGREPDIGSPEHMAEYFRRLYNTGNVDEHDVQNLRAARKFATIAREYRIIDEATTPVVVVNWGPHTDEIRDLLDELRRAPSRRLFRRLGAYQVNIRYDQRAQHASQMIPDACGAVIWTGVYGTDIGLDTEEPVISGPI